MSDAGLFQSILRGYTMLRSLRDAAKAVQELGRTGGLNASAKNQLTRIADALGEADERIKALEAVVEELAVGAKPKVRGPMANSPHVQKLLGANRT
jgi:hypothetical protein